MSKKKKNIYLMLFNIGVLIILIPQLRILYNEFRLETDHQTFELMVSQAELSEESPIETNNDVLQAENGTVVAGEMPQVVETYTEVITEYVDPFNYDVAAPKINSSQNNIIAYIHIPKIGERLPIYLGATNDHLSKGAAHVVGSSLPLGGESTHSVVSAHRGYAGANYFRHIDLLKTGDQFTITGANGQLTYEVTETKIISPDDISHFSVEQGEDWVTLLSCHPYMINDERIIVHARRVDNNKTALHMRYDHLVASTQTDYLGINKQRFVGEEEESTLKVLVDIVFKFTDKELAQQVKNDVIVNRLIIVLGIIAIFISTGMMIKNSLIE